MSLDALGLEDPKIIYPDVEASFDQNKRQRLLGVGKTAPNLAVHEKSMM